MCSLVQWDLLVCKLKEMPACVARHYIVEENLNRRNGRYVPDNRQVGHA